MAPIATICNDEQTTTSSTSSLSSSSSITTAVQPITNHSGTIVPTLAEVAAAAASVAMSVGTTTVITPMIIDDDNNDDHNVINGGDKLTNGLDNTTQTTSITIDTNNIVNGQINRKSALTGSTEDGIPCPIRAPLVVTIVGLPCRGKSLAAHKVARHLWWKGELAKVFPVDVNTTQETLTEIVDWFQSGNNVAIIDGMNLQRQSRQLVGQFCNENVFHHLIIEFECDEKSLNDNIIDTAKFRQCCEQQQPQQQQPQNKSDWVRILIDKEKLHQFKYEKCAPTEGALICVNNSENSMYHAVTARGVQGAIQTSILGVLASPVIRKQVFYFSRHGESDFNVLGRIGGDADLSSRGRKYSERLTRLLDGNTTNADYPKPKLIWTSEFCRTVHTAENISGPRAAIKDLNEINAGICEGLTYEEIQERFPQEFAWRDQDKLKYRYPHGESYLDLLQRVDSVVQALLTKSDVLVVSHQAVLRCIMAYFIGTKPDGIPYINVPLHTVLVVRSYGYNFQVEQIPLKVDCVDTYRIQPQNCSSGRTDADALVTVPVHFDTPLPQVIKN